MVARCEAVAHHREAFCYTRRKSCSNPCRESSSHYHRRHPISWNRQICHWVVVVHQLLSFNVDNLLLKHPPLDNVSAERKKCQLKQIHLLLINLISPHRIGNVLILSSILMYVHWVNYDSTNTVIGRSTFELKFTRFCQKINWSLQVTWLISQFRIFLSLASSYQ